MKTPRTSGVVLWLSVFVAVCGARAGVTWAQGGAWTPKRYPELLAKGPDNGAERRGQPDAGDVGTGR